MKTKLKIVILILLACGETFAQKERTVDFYQEIKNYDLSVVLTADSIRDDERTWLPRSQILGFIGEDFQRFQIHFILMIQNAFNPYEYFVYGKTKVKNVICSFQGVLTIKEAKLYVEIDWIDNTIKQGCVVCDVQFFEDKKQNSTGFIKGTLTSSFIIDKNNKMEYDAIMLVADGYSNNEFVGNWTSYKTGKSKKCNWGDYRIPESHELDVGTGEFMIDEKYKNNGWEDYYFIQKNSYYPNCESEEYKVVMARENKKWWCDIYDEDGNQTKTKVFK